jgi:hypothetical protein
MKVTILGHNVGKAKGFTHNKLHLVAHLFTPNQRYKFPPCHSLHFSFRKGLWTAFNADQTTMVTGSIIDYMKKGIKR